MQQLTNQYRPLKTASRPKIWRRLNSHHSLNGGGTVVNLLIFIVLVAAIGLVFLNHQNITDAIRLHQNPPNGADISLANQDTMTAYARKVFYVNVPQISSQTSFASQCPNNGGEKTIVLGCYHSDQAGIFLLNVTDPLLNGVQQVTAAHETLHAIYDRLSAKKRASVDAMLLDYYHHDLKDQRIITNLNAYKISEPNDVVNEMHSIFGTEVASLPAPLETYYSQYFTDRHKIASYAAQYQSEFTSRQATVATDDTQLASSKTQIDSTEASLKSQLSAITTEQQTLASDRSSGAISTYNAAVPGYNAMVDAYNSGVASLQSLIDQYNALVQSRNAVALQEQQLTNELTSTATPIQ